MKIDMIIHVPTLNDWINVINYLLSVGINWIK